MLEWGLDLQLNPGHLNAIYSQPHDHLYQWKSPSHEQFELNNSKVHDNCQWQYEHWYSVNAFEPCPSTNELCDLRGSHN